MTAVVANQILIAYTLAGDANLDGSVGFDDLVPVAQNFGKTGQDWAHGNFNYDPAGSVGFADLVNVAQNFGRSTPIATGAASAQGLSPIWQSTHLTIQSTAVSPEPSGLALATIAASALLCRRRRRVC